MEFDDANIIHYVFIGLIVVMPFNKSCSQRFVANIIIKSSTQMKKLLQNKRDPNQNRVYLKNTAFIQY
jgi:hypothetical protein